MVSVSVVLMARTLAPARRRAAGRAAEQPVRRWMTWTPHADTIGGDSSPGGIVAIRLHRCSNEWVKLSGHPCWRVQKALDEQGVEYELVKGPLRRGKRDELEEKSGQRLYPVIEFEDGTCYREEGKDMAARIEAGKLFEGRAA